MHSTLLSLGDLVVEKRRKNTALVLVELVFVAAFLEVLDHDHVRSVLYGRDVLEGRQGVAVAVVVFSLFGHGESFCLCYCVLW